MDKGLTMGDVAASAHTSTSLLPSNLPLFSPLFLSFALAQFLKIFTTWCVIYDASGVRLHAGRQPELLNQIVCELPPEHPLSNVRPLRDSLGHSPVQVIAGSLLGCLIAFLMRRNPH